MIIKRIVRGKEFEFAVLFTDADGGTVNPTVVKLHLDYVGPGGDRLPVTIDMEEATDGSWVAFWDSSVALKGRVHWSIRAHNPSDADQGSFDLLANLANPDPEETTA